MRKKGPYLHTPGQLNMPLQLGTYLMQVGRKFSSSHPTRHPMCCYIPTRRAQYSPESPGLHQATLMYAAGQRYLPGTGRSPKQYQASDYIVLQQEMQDLRCRDSYLLTTPTTHKPALWHLNQDLPDPAHRRQTALLLKARQNNLRLLVSRRVIVTRIDLWVSYVSSARHFHLKQTCGKVSEIT